MKYPSLSKITLLVAAVGLMGTSSVLGWKPDFIPPPEQLKKMEEVNTKRRHEKNTTAAMYGKVMDFDGNPVSDAKVAVRLTSVPRSVLRNDQRLLHAVTDAGGLFKVEGTGFSLYIANIEKQGYQFSAGFSEEQNLNFVKGKKNAGTGYEPDKPMIFKVRKKHPPSYSLSGTGGLFELRPGENRYWDMYQRMSASDRNLMQREIFYKDWHPDVKVCVEHDGTRYRLIFESIDPGSGFAISTHRFEDEFRKAPENGYQPKLVIPIDEGESGGVHAYVRNEGGLFYSRMSVSYAHREGNDYVKIESRYSTNMTGGRVFEYDAEFNERYSKLREQVKAPPLIRKHLRDGTIVLPVQEPEK